MQRQPLQEYSSKENQEKNQGAKETRKLTENCFEVFSYAKPCWKKMEPILRIIEKSGNVSINEDDKLKVAQRVTSVDATSFPQNLLEGSE